MYVQWEVFNKEMSFRLFSRGVDGGGQHARLLACNVDDGSVIPAIL